MTLPAPSPLLARAAAGTLAVFGANGFMFASWMSRVPAVRDTFGLTPGQLSVLLLAISAGSLIGLPLAGRITQRFDARAAVCGGAVVSLSGLVAAISAVALAPNHLWLLPGLFACGLGIGIWDVAQNLHGAAVEHRMGRSIMPWFHAAFSGGTVVGALGGVAAIALGVPVTAHLLAVAAVAAAVILGGSATFVRAVEEPDPVDPAAPAAPARAAWTEPRTLLVGVMVLAAAFTEGTANDWLAVAFIDGHGIRDEYGVAALAVFLTAMTLARVLGTHLLDRHGRQKVLTVLFTAALAGCVAVVFGPTWLAFVGAAVWGIGASLGFPVGMSASSDEPARAPARIAVVSTIGYTAFLAGPALIGAIGDHVGVLRALLAVGAAALLALLVLPATKQPASATMGA